MKSRELVWLYDNEGNNITVVFLVYKHGKSTRMTLKRQNDLPQSVKYLKDDPYRTLAMYVRQVSPQDVQVRRVVLLTLYEVIWLREVWIQECKL
eukprot:643157-Hanusia_phi.AAC.2